MRLWTIERVIVPGIVMKSRRPSIYTYTSVRVRTHPQKRCLWFFKRRALRREFAIWVNFLLKTTRKHQNRRLFTSSSSSSSRTVIERATFTFKSMYDTRARSTLSRAYFVSRVTRRTYTM